MKCTKKCWKLSLFVLTALLLMLSITACNRDDKKQEDMAGPGESTSLNNAYEDGNQDNDLTPGQSSDHLNSATSGETQSGSEQQSEDSSGNAGAQSGNGTDNSTGAGNNGNTNTGSGDGNVIDDIGNDVGDAIDDVGDAIKNAGNE